MVHHTLQVSAEAAEATEALLRLLAESVARGVPTGLTDEQREHHRAGQWSTFSAGIHRLRSIRAMPFSPADHGRMMRGLIRCTDAVQEAIDQLTRDAGRLCPVCGHLPVADYNTLPAKFWQSDRQTVSCEHCRTTLQRNGGYGAPAAASVWRQLGR